MHHLSMGDDTWEDGINNRGKPHAPLHLWLVGALALFGAMGAVRDYLLMNTQNAAYLAGMPPEWQAVVFEEPLWVDFVWAITTWSALLGSILLLFRERLAFWMLAASSLALVADQAFVYLGPAGAMMTNRAIVFNFVLLIISLFLTLYSWAMKRRGVLC